MVGVVVQGSAHKAHPTNGAWFGGVGGVTPMVTPLWAWLVAKGGRRGTSGVTTCPSPPRIPLGALLEASTEVGGGGCLWAPDPTDPLLVPPAPPQPQRRWRRCQTRARRSRAPACVCGRTWPRCRPSSSTRSGTAVTPSSTTRGTPPRSWSWSQVHPEGPMGRGGDGGPHWGPGPAHPMCVCVPQRHQRVHYAGTADELPRQCGDAAQSPSAAAPGVLL